MIGFTDPCKVDFSFAMTVARVHEDPRVTRPYTDAQWEAIDALGHRVDSELARDDVRLTQGGEPTFVSIDDMDGDEWNFTALSPKKRELAETLLRKMAARIGRAGSFTRDRASGIPASRCRGGRSASTGAPTASRSGATPR